MGIFKVIAGIGAPLILVGGGGMAGGETYYQLKVDGLKPHEVHINWQERKIVPHEGTESAIDITLVKTVTKDFRGLGKAEVSGKLIREKTGYEFLDFSDYGDYGHWVIPQGQALPKDILFDGKPDVQFENEVYRNTATWIQLASLLTGLAGTVGALAYASKKGYFKSPHLYHAA